MRDSSDFPFVPSEVEGGGLGAVCLDFARHERGGPKAVQIGEAIVLEGKRRLGSIIKCGHRLRMGVMPLFMAACGSGASPIIKMDFSATDWVFDRPGPASDYIADFHTKIPKAAKHCQVKLLGLNGGITDGGEAAYFMPIHDIAAAQTCLKRTLPQGHFEVIERREWDKMTKENPEFPVPLTLIPKQIEMPPPPADR